MKTLAFRVVTIALSAMFLFPAITSGQDGLLATPRSEKLLNDLNVLIWSTAGTDKVRVRLRIHNGAAYDPRDKQGTFAMLGDILFPEEGVKEFFREDLGGDLIVTVNYDYVEVTATARSDAFLTVLETLAPALMNTEITKEKAEQIGQKQLTDVEKLRGDPEYKVLAAAAERLFGDFPYGRRYEGTPASLEKIDFGDLIYVRERFLTADNTTLLIYGDVRSDYAYLAARRLMGGWNKAGTNIPATFRLPESPDVETQYLYTEGLWANRSAAAVESYARNDKMYHAAEILARITDQRLSSGSGQQEATSAKAINDGYLLKGMFRVYTEDLLQESTVPGASSRIPARKSLETWLKLPVTPNEFARAKSAYVEEFRNMGADKLRADVETYKLGSVEEELKRVEGLSAEDVQAAASELLKRPIVEVVMISRPSAAPPVIPEDPKDPFE